MMFDISSQKDTKKKEDHWIQTNWIPSVVQIIK